HRDRGPADLLCHRQAADADLGPTPVAANLDYGQRPSWRVGTRTVKIKAGDHTLTAADPSSN
ncbi:hypothetical protein, partial [Mycobacterium marinum]|uniref:hypothetical protein n=1 Tax=Mycobacterium marinum TaxID=1781 RepID=UPI00356A463F